MYCIVCEKKLNSDDNYDPFINGHETFWFNGAVGQLEVNYGSKFDGDILVISICDDCISKKIESYTLLYKDNYIFGSEIVESSINSSKKGYNRRLNLDKLTGDQ